MKAFDKDGNGQVSYDEFVRTIWGDINDFRLNLIKWAYTEKLDANHDGWVTLDDIGRIYDVSKHPDVMNGVKSKEDVYNEFMSKWEKDGDEIVTLQEFVEYFRDVSCNVDRDDYFDAMMKNAWKI